MRKEEEKLKNFLELLLLKAKGENEGEKRAAEKILVKLIPQINSNIIKRYKKLYLGTLNPLYIWRAYQFCRDKKLQIPEWILDYFDTVSRSIFQLTKLDKKRKERRLHNALGISLRNLNQYDDINDKLIVYDAIIEKREELAHGEKTDIYALVAKLTGVRKSESAIEGYFYDIKKIFENPTKDES
jgi:hypothetical protein